LRELESEFETEMEEVRLEYDPTLEELETVYVRPKKKDISVNLLALAWAPHWKGAGGEAVEAF
jgi:hypothetical protein